MPRSSTTFGPGNLAAVKHGAQSPRLVQATRHVTGARFKRQLEKRSEAVLIDLGIDVRSRLTRLAEYLDTNGGSLVTRRGKVRGCAPLYLSLVSRMITISDRLAIGKQPVESNDPLSVWLRREPDE